MGIELSLVLFVWGVVGNKRMPARSFVGGRHVTTVSLVLEVTKLDRVAEPSRSETAGMGRMYVVEWAFGHRNRNHLEIEDGFDALHANRWRTWSLWREMVWLESRIYMINEGVVVIARQIVLTVRL